MDLFLRDFFAVEIIVTVPLAIERILGKTDIVTKAEGSIVIHDAVQVIVQVKLELVFHEIRIGGKRSQIEIPDREVD